MKIIVDGDACPVKKVVIRLCNQYHIRLIFVYSISHMPKEDYEVESVIVDNEYQAADMAIVNHLEKGDLVITADIGLAALVLGKGAHALNYNGYFYTNDNINQLLENRYINQKILMSGGRLKGPKKRNNRDNEYFEGALEKFIQKHCRNISFREGD